MALALGYHPFLEAHRIQTRLPDMLVRLILRRVQANETKQWVIRINIDHQLLEGSSPQLSRNTKEVKNGELS
jgi:hypothetical protein